LQPMCRVFFNLHIPKFSPEMKRILLLLLAPALIHAQSQRQTVYNAVPDCYVQSFTPLAGGGNLLSGYSRYGTDSCLINLVFMNDSDVTISHKEFNTATHFDFVSHVIPVSNGFLLGGKSSDPLFFHPQLIKTDANGNVLWAKYFDNTSYWHGQIIRIIPNGNTYSMYTFAETPFNDFYRIETDAGGTTFSGMQFLVDTGMSFRIFDAEQVVNSSSHVLCGHANFNSTTTRGGLLMQTGPGSVQWCRHITAAGNFKNDIVDVTAGTDGHSYSVFVCENMPGNQYSTIVMKFDSLGNKVWAKQLSLTSGTLNGCSIIESAAHDFYVASYDNLFMAYISKLDVSGNLVWTRKWTPSSLGGASALKLFKDANGNIVFTGMLDNSYFVARLDADAGGCSFSNTTVISAANINPVITNITFTAAAFTPTTVNEPVVYSALGYTENMICGGLAVDELTAGLLVVYPVPAGDKLRIQMPDGAWKNGSVVTGISVFSMPGERVLTVSTEARNPGTGMEIGLSSLSPGIYIVQLSSGERFFRGKFIKE
jgi:hypothetical protein